VIQAYPSSIGFLAAWMLSAGLRYRRELVARYRDFPSETLSISTPGNRKRPRLPGIRLVRQFERVAAIGTCERGPPHLLPNYSYVRCCRPKTACSNWSAPGQQPVDALDPISLRRSRASRARNRALRLCGRSFPLIEQVVGRIDDPIKLPGGRFRSSSTISSRAWKGNTRKRRSARIVSIP